MEYHSLKELTADNYRSRRFKYDPQLKFRKPLLTSHQVAATPVQTVYLLTRVLLGGMVQTRRGRAGRTQTEHNLPRDAGWCCCSSSTHMTAPLN